MLLAVIEAIGRKRGCIVEGCGANPVSQSCVDPAVRLPQCQARADWP
jgi:hypothetical protein